MKSLEEYIKNNSKVLPGDILKVDSFLNHQLDVKLLKKIADEFKRKFKKDNVTKILTVESSGIAIATMCGYVFDCPVVFAKKSQTKNLNGSIYMAKIESYTQNRIYDVCVAKEFLSPEDRILIVDDFLANGKALNGLVDIVEVSKATLVGAGIVIEKSFQEGPEIMKKRNVRVESLAKIKSMGEQGIEFID